MSAPDIPILETERLILRRVRESDVDAFWPAFSDEATMRYWSRAPFTDRAEFADYLLDESWGGRTWIGETREAPRPVTRIVMVPDKENVAEIGYIAVLGEGGKGYAKEALSAVLTQLLSAEGHRRVWADVDPDNTPSNRLLASLGFTHEGTLRAAWETHIGVRDSYIWGLLAEEWGG